MDENVRPSSSSKSVEPQRAFPSRSKVSNMSKVSHKSRESHKPVAISPSSRSVEHQGHSSHVTHHSTHHSTHPSNHHTSFEIEKNPRDKDSCCSHSKSIGATTSHQHTAPPRPQPPPRCLTEAAFFSTIILFMSVLMGLVNVSYNSLPKVPKNIKHDIPVFSEHYARFHLQNIVSFGPRPAGSMENDHNTALYIKKEVQKLVRLLGQEPVRTEVEITDGQGEFGLDFLGGFGSSYQGVVNTVVRLSSPHFHESDNSLLVNCHTDSAIGTVGASDDAVSCAIMLEIIRVIMALNKPLRSPIIFLFNGAEENILQGSHSFITNHRFAPQVKAFINLEAAGAGGKEIVFQTGPNNPGMAITWARSVPYPFGTVIAEDLFQSGFVKSDTDFRIFRDFGHIPGIDLAYMKNGYVYHTKYDNVSMISTGSIQRTGENMLEMVKALSSNVDSILHFPDKYKHGNVAFFDILGLTMIVIPAKLLFIFNWIIYFLQIGYFANRFYYSPSDVTQCCGVVHGMRLGYALTSMLLSSVCLFLAPLLVAFILIFSGNTMTFYSDWRIAVLLYLPLAVVGYIKCMRSLTKYFFPYSPGRAIDIIYKDAMITILTLLLICLTTKGIKSSVFLAIFVVPNFARRFFQFYVTKDQGSVLPPGLCSEHPILVKLIITLCINIVPLLIFLQNSHLLMEFFIPLTGRMGTEMPSDIIVSLLVSASLLPLMLVVSDSIHYVKSFRRCYKFFVRLTIVVVIAATYGHFVPYQVTDNQIAPMRLIAQHTHRTFYGIAGQVTVMDSGILVHCLDYRCMTTETNHLPLDQAQSIVCRKGLFCHWPWYVPLEKGIRRSRYIATDPPVSTDIKQHPLSVRLEHREVEVLSKNKTHTELMYRINLAIRGPSHVSLQIGPLQSRLTKSKLSKWSLDIDPNSVKRKSTIRHSSHEGYHFNKWYFVYRHNGCSYRPWRVQLEFHILSLSDKFTSSKSHPHYLGCTYPVVEVGVSAHYLPTNAHMCSTAQLNNVKDDLHDFIALTCFESIYENFIY